MYFWLDSHTIPMSHVHAAEPDIRDPNIVLIAVVVPLAVILVVLISAGECCYI